MSNIAFSKAQTQILKGIALILMIIHHTSTPSLWAENGSMLNSYFSFQTGATKMCVWIFSFLVGYGFFCSKHKSIRYSLKRILLLLIPFWLMMLLLFIPSAYFSGYFHNYPNCNMIGVAMFPDLVCNLLGLSETLNWYSWFVFFYILSILTLPNLHKVYLCFPKSGWLVSIVVFYIFSVAIHFIPNWEGNVLLQNIFTFTTLVPVVIVGYMCAKWNHEEKIPLWFEGKNRFFLH